MFACSSDIVSEVSKREVKYLRILIFLQKPKIRGSECLNKLRTALILKSNYLQLRVISQKLTFGTPSVSSRLSAPAGHLPHQAVLPWDTEKLLAARASWLPSPLAQDRGVVVIRGHLATGRLVGVTGGMALAQGVGLLCLQQVGAPAVHNGAQ